MLVLERNPGQAIMIGDEVKITILGINADNGDISVGIEAPRHIEINRQEIYLNKERKAERKKARKKNHPDTPTEPNHVTPPIKKR